MTNSKCKQCGLVNPFNALVCKRCGAPLVAGEIPDAPVIAADTPDVPQIADHPDATRIIGDNPDAPRVAPLPAEEEAEKENKPLGFWGCVQVLIFLAIAGSITGYLGIYIMDFLPAGRYPIVLLIALFLPAAIVGSAAGGLVLYLIHLLVKAVKGGGEEESKK